MKYTYIFYSLIIIYILSIGGVSAVNATEAKKSNCDAIDEYEVITTTVGSLMLMIFGFTFIIYFTKIHPAAILVGIITIIIGFGGLLLGNYAFAMIFGLLC